MSAQTISGSKDDITLNLSGLARIYLATWPFLRPELAHFAGLLAGTLALIGFGTAVGFLGFDILWDAVGSASPLSSAQASMLMLPKVSFVDVASLSTADRFTLLNHFLVLTAFIVVTSTTAGSGLAVYKVWILQRVNQHLRMQMVANAEALSLRHHGESEAGDAMYRVFQDSAMVTAVIDNIIVVPVIGLTTLCMQGAIAALFSPWFAFLLMTAVVTLILAVGAATPRLRRASVDAREAGAVLYNRVQETFQGVSAIKAYAFETANSRAFDAESRAVIDAGFAIRRDFAAIKAAVSWSLAVVLFATDYIATRYVLVGAPVFGASLLVLFGLSVTAWTVAAHQARRGAVGAFQGTLEELIRVWCLAQDMAMGLGRALRLLTAEAEVRDPDTPVTWPAAPASISANDVWFGYDPARPVLRDTSFVARRAEITALVGPSGSGKTTLTSLLLRLFDPDEGSIDVDGVSLSSFAIAELRSRIAVALQENVLFPTTIRENLRYAAGTADDEAVRRALEVACADFVFDLPQGLDTELGVRGALLSTGQKQRLSIARALIRNPDILILDEPTASLDADTERRVLANLRTWAAQRIVIVITHRLSTIRDADSIAVLEGGTIVETGTHEALASAGGTYAALIAAAAPLETH